MGRRECHSYFMKSPVKFGTAAVSLEFPLWNSALYVSLSVLRDWRTFSAFCSVTFTARALPTTVEGVEACELDVDVLEVSDAAVRQRSAHSIK